MKLDWLKRYNLLIFDVVDSTNSEALRLASSVPSGDFVIVTREQTGGRGQKGNSWVSVEENLHMSILLTSSANPASHPQLSFLAANALYEAINFLAKKQGVNLDIKLKWPNDVLVGGRKIAGILLESISFNGKNYVVIGFGANVMEAPKIDAGYKTTSLLDEGIVLNHADEFMNILVNKFDRLYAQWFVQGNFIKTRKDWLRRAYNLKKIITMDDGSRRISGIFKGIDLDGAMILQLNDGQLCTINSGTIVSVEA